MNPLTITTHTAVIHFPIFFLLLLARCVWLYHRITSTKWYATFEKEKKIGSNYKVQFYAHRSMINVRRSSTNSGVGVLRCVNQTGTVIHLMANYECGFILFIETVKWWIRNSFYIYIFHSLFFSLLYFINYDDMETWFFSFSFYWKLRTE